MEIEESKDVIKSSFDKLNYKIITLPNKLQCLLISDECYNSIKIIIYII